MKDVPVTEKRASALNILREGEMAVENFAKRMWRNPVAPKFARHFLDGLVKLGYVALREEGKEAHFKVTDEGQEILTVWQCNYCGAAKWKRKVKLLWMPCRKCGKDHRACPKCTKQALVVDGEFPKYKPVLRECPK